MRGLLRITLGSLVIGALVVQGIGCRSKDDGRKKLRVGFSQIGAESAWRTAETESVKSEATKRGIKLKFSDAQQKQENQIKAVRSFVTQGVDAILLAPLVETGWEPVLKEAKRAGIPVILLDRSIMTDDDSLYTTLITADFIAEGRRAAEWFAQKTGGKCRIIELQGTPGSAPAIDRQKGFEQEIAKHPEMKIIASQSGNFTRTGGKKVMEALLKMHENIDAVYAHNDDMAIGAIQAIKGHGKKPGTDILVVSIDGIKDAFRALIAGELNASVECPPLLGPLAFDAVEKAVAGEKQARKTLIKNRLFEKKEATELIDTRRY